MEETFSRSEVVGIDPLSMKPAKDFLVVGLGASAGGIKALKEFFAHVPAASGMAYVVILHLSPEHESKLAEVLQVVAAIPVTQVTDQVHVEPNHVYVIPPNQSLSMEDGHLSLSEVTRVEERRAPVDIFFRTLAQSHTTHAIAVILSGTGADGSMGMKRIKEMGGICIVQEPNEAEYSDMPRNSLATGLVDYALPVAEIPAKIIAYKEHLGSTAEELETSKEELQSVNEELRTVNQELKVKLEELSQANNDFQNLIAATEIGTVFLDRSLRVKLYTPPARQIFNFIPSDTGRPLSDITHGLKHGDLREAAEQVLETLEPFEREVETHAGRWHLARLLPYRTTEDRIAGIVMTFLDITERKRAEQSLRRSEERLRLLVESVTDYAIIIQDTAGQIEHWNTGAERMFGFTEKEAVGQHIRLIFTPEDQERGAAEDEMKQAREVGSASDERWHMRKDGSRFYVSGVLTALREDRLIGYAKIARDLTGDKRAEEELQRVREELELKVEERTLELAQANEALRAENAERRQIERARVDLLRKLVRTQEDERRRIARDIHDHLGQQSTALRLKLEAIKNQCQDYAELCEPIAQAQEIAAGLDSNVDFLAWELRPAVLDDLGLSAALANFVREWSRNFNIPAEYHTLGVEGVRPSPEVEINFYRIAQEALNNIYKHAHASRVDLLLEQRNHQIVLIVEDDGIGLAENKEGQDRGLGLLGMRERAALLGGTLEIESAPGEGTTIFARVPAAFTKGEEG